MKLQEYHLLLILSPCAYKLQTASISTITYIVKEKDRSTISYNLLVGQLFGIDYHFTYLISHLLFLIKHQSRMNNIILNMKTLPKLRVDQLNVVSLSQFHTQPFGMGLVLLYKMPHSVFLKYEKYGHVAG